MTSRFLLDTNILSEPLRPTPSPHVIRQLARNRGQLSTSTVVYHELAYGLERLPESKKKEIISEYLEDLKHSRMPILPYDLKSAIWHAKERARLEKIGRILPFRDTQIAAIAKTQELILVTRNVRDFEDIEGIDLQNWFEA